MYTNFSVKRDKLIDKDINMFLEIYKFVGFQRLIIDFSYQKGYDYHSELEKIKEKTELDVFGRITIKINSKEKLKKILSNYSKLKSFIIAIESSNKDLLTFAANDSRIDIISFPGIIYIKEITPGILSLIEQQQKFLEISFNEVISKKKYERSKNFREIFKLLNQTSKCEKIFIYGGSEPESRFIRGPIEIISIFHSIFDIPLKNCKKFLRENPSILIQKLNNRNNPDYIEPDIKIINRKQK